MLPADLLEIITNGGYALTDQTDTPPCPKDLLYVGHHFDDISEAFCRPFMRRGLNKGAVPIYPYTITVLGGSI